MDILKIKYNKSDFAKNYILENDKLNLELTNKEKKIKIKCYCDIFISHWSMKQHLLSKRHILYSKLDIHINEKKKNI
jgi:hypothetical protein